VFELGCLSLASSKHQSQTTKLKHPSSNKQARTTNLKQPSSNTQAPTTKLKQPSSNTQAQTTIAIFRMCYGENGTVNFLETLAENVFRHSYSMMQV
jgi:hypothetical protein